VFKYDPDNRLWRVLDKVGSALILNLLWLLSCLPIVTVGPATAAMYETVRKFFLRGEGALVPTYLKAFRANLKQAIPLGLVAVVILGVVIAGVMTGMSQGLLAVGAAVLVGGIFVVCVLFWCVPLAARFTNTAGAHLKNGVLLGLGNLGSTLLLLAALVAAVLAVAQFVPLVFIVPVGLMIMWTARLEAVFRKRGYVPA